MARITVEDCLRRENNRFALVLLASKRAKQLLTGASALTDTKGNKCIVSALREIADDKVRFMSADEAAEAERLELERAEEVRSMPAVTQVVITPSNGQNGDSSENGEDKASDF